MSHLHNKETGKHFIQEKKSCDDFKNREETVWMVESNIDRYNQQFTMGFKNNDKIKNSKELYLMNIRRNNKCYSMLFIKSKDKKADFNVTITVNYKNGDIKSCKFINLNKQS